MSGVTYRRVSLTYACHSQMRVNKIRVKSHMRVTHMECPLLTRVIHRRVSLTCGVTHVYEQVSPGREFTLILASAKKFALCNICLKFSAVHGSVQCLCQRQLGFSLESKKQNLSRTIEEKLSQLGRLGHSKPLKFSKK